MDESQFEVLLARLDSLGERLDQISNCLDTSPGVRSLSTELNTALVRLASGQRLYVDSRDIGVASHIMTRGSWEAPYVSAARSLIRPGDTCVDVGANFGYYSVIMAALTGSKGSVLSFEPNPHVYKFLEKSLRVNGFLMSGVAKPFQVALGATSGSARLSFKMGDFGGGSLFSSAERIDAENLETVDVAVRALDEFDIDMTRPIFMKVDAEGGEFDVLRGAKKTIEKATEITVMLEFTPAFIRKHLPVDMFVDFVTDLGLTLNVVDSGILRPINKDALLALGNCYVFARRT